VRATMFYKDAFYDRDAFLNTTRRFGVTMDHDYLNEVGAIRFNVTDGGEVVFTSEEQDYHVKYDNEYFAMERKARAEAEAWLDERYPDWRSSAAYWD